jgi:hypothetical protein
MYLPIDNQINQMALHWNIQSYEDKITVRYHCNVHNDISYKNLKKLEANLIEIFPGRRFFLDYVYPNLVIIGPTQSHDREKIHIVIKKNKFCKPKTTYRSTKPSSPDEHHRHWEITKPKIIFERRDQTFL